MQRSNVMRRQFSDVFQAELAFKNKNKSDQDSDNSGNNSLNTNLKFNLKWYTHDDRPPRAIQPLYYLWSEELASSEKIASFDIDNTLIVTKSGDTFGRDEHDWEWFDKLVPERLRQLHEEGFRILFITNQGGIETGLSPFRRLKQKFETLVSLLDIPVFIFVATYSRDIVWRKPSAAMWSFFLENCNKDMQVDMDKCFFVGDAAGRPDDWNIGKKADFSCSDRLFAMNAKLKFYTPEEFFLNEPEAPYFLDEN